MSDTPKITFGGKSRRLFDPEERFLGTDDKGRAIYSQQGWIRWEGGRLFVSRYDEYLDWPNAGTYMLSHSPWEPYRLEAKGKNAVHLMNGFETRYELAKATAS